jgi:hypothetical protein
MRRLLALAVLGASLGLGLAAGWRAFRTAPAPADPPAVVEKVREAARLEVLEVSLYKKLSYAPEPEPAGSFWGDVAGFLRHTFAKPAGRAIVFADARLGLDLSKLGPSSVRVTGTEAWIVLPPLRVTVELRPGETEVIGSNLDSAETARLFELARVAFQREVEADAALRARARGSAERAIRALLAELGIVRVSFVDELPAPRPS